MARSRSQPDEVTILDVRPHLWRLAGPVILAVVVVAGDVRVQAQDAGRAVEWAGSGLVVVALAWMVSRYLRWAGTRLVVTSQRLRYSRGIVARRGGDIPLGAVTDVEHRQTILGRLTGTGDLVVETGGPEGRRTFRALPRPRRVAAAVMAARDARTGSGDDAVAGRLQQLARLRSEGAISTGEFGAEWERLVPRR